MRERLTTAGEVVGASAVAVGCGLWSVPLGVVVGGVLLIAGCVLAALGGES